METWDAIRARRNVRSYSQEPVPDSDLDRIAEAGWRAPATDLSVGTGHSAVGDQDKARSILGVPDGHIVSYLLGIGYPDDRPLKPIVKPNRRPFSEVVHHGRW
jgi:nitroreductase